LELFACVVLAPKCLRALWACLDWLHWETDESTAPGAVKHPLSGACTPNIEELSATEDEPVAQYTGPTMCARERRGERWEH
jgi:hypothetical protein